MNSSFGYVNRRRRPGRTARQRRRNRRLYSLDRALGMGRFAAADHRERIMRRLENRANIESLYASAIGRLMLQERPRYQRRDNPGNRHHRMRGNIIDPAYTSTHIPTAPRWRGELQRNRASMPGPMADNVIDPALYISRIGAPIQGAQFGRSRLGFSFNSN